MNTKFDELTKAMAQSVTRRQALKKFGVGLASMALACFGLADKAHAGKCQDGCRRYCRKQFPVGSADFEYCYEVCLIQSCSGP